MTNKNLIYYIHQNYYRESYDSLLFPYLEHDDLEFIFRIKTSTCEKVKIRKTSGDNYQDNSC